MSEESAPTSPGTTMETTMWNWLPNKNQILSFVRWAVTAVGMYAVGKGWVSENLAIEIGTFVVAILAGAWGIQVHTKKATVAQAAEIVVVPVASQKEVGIPNPQTVPTSPPAPTARVS